MLKFITRVRKDGAINFRAAGRQQLGIVAGSMVDVTIEKGKCVIKPTEYVCAVCNRRIKHVIDDTGICEYCNNLICSYIKSGKVTTIGDAIKSANMAYNSKYKPY